MIDIFNLQDKALNTQVFYTNGGTNAWQTWEKPKNCKFVYVFVLGGGGGGGGGDSVLSNGAGGGGAGGGAGFSNGFFNAHLIPDRLYVQVGTGGAGGAGGTGGVGLIGGAGLQSYVCVQSTKTAQDIMLMNGNATAGAGGPGLAGSAGAGGAAGTIMVQTNLLASYLGTCFFIAGQSGTIGGTGGSTLTSQSLILPYGGGGTGGGGFTLGGSSDVTGSIVGAGIIPNISGGTNSNVGAGGDGQDGYVGQLPSINLSMSRPMFFTGGAGGGAGQTTGGNGGNGGYGCGGGGGGASNSGGKAGNGGKGGDGLVIITSF